ncbi:ABC transporter substrate-binding protein [Alkaliphilus sp. B6464]|uniref:ABC transporter substrate-binding protein n=1 Tax=Alkaliphilus sp. B6464 TaxID=2731219 RepID=UPI001BAAF044|nr:ABC transporter substrate-binding protein [Alkaliphilus sp. B6464]QUH21382.1 ABC transporter substrate-binding protein [Alkaliphilus sp. B6464]
MKKKFPFYLLACILFLSMFLTGCTPNDKTGKQTTNNEETEIAPDSIEVSIGFVDGIPALSIAKLAKETPLFKENITVDYDLIKGSDLIVSKVMNKELDIAIVPSNLASIVYNQGESYLIGALSGFGNLYVVSRETIHSLEDLKGREITTIGKGLTPDIVFQYVLKSNSIDPLEDITINYMGGATELAPAFLSKKAEIILAPEPMISTILSKDPTAKIQFSLNELFAKVTKSDLGFPQTVLIVKKELLNNHPEFVNSFLDEYNNSVKWAIDYPQELEKYGIEVGITIPTDILNKDSIKRMNLNFISGNQMKDVYMKYVNVLFEFEPKTIGGKLPNEGIFFTK